MERQILFYGRYNFSFLLSFSFSPPFFSPALFSSSLTVTQTIPVITIRSWRWKDHVGHRTRSKGKRPGGAGEWGGVNCNGHFYLVRLLHKNA